MADYEELDLGYVGEGSGDIALLIDQKIAGHNAEEAAHFNRLNDLETLADNEAAERVQNEGNLADLQTQNKSSLTSAVNETFVKSVKLLSESTQRLYSNFALRAYVDETTGEARAYKLLGTAPDGTEHNLVELAQYGAEGKAEIGDRTISLNLNTKGGPGVDNRVTVETDDAEGEAVTLPLAYLADVISQCAQALGDAKNYADEKDAALRIDALIIQPPCDESGLPQYDSGEPWEQSHNGYWYQIKDFDVTRPGQNIKGTATWYDDLGEGEPGYYLAYDKYRNADGVTTKLTDEGAIAVNDITENDTAADTNPFTALDNVSFPDLIKSLIKKINGSFQLTASINTILQEIQRDRPISQFTYVVDNDDKAAAWANNIAGNDYTSVLIIGGTFNVPGPINLGAAGTKRVSGIPGATLTFHGSAQSCLYYDAMPEDISSYGINNITVQRDITDDTDHYGLVNCINLKRVTVDLTNSNGHTRAFHQCAMIDNCVANVTAISEGQVIGFYDCDQLTNCFAGLVTAQGNACAYYGNTGPQHCDAAFGTGNTGTNTMFQDCSGMLRNRAGTNTTPGYNYVNCFVSESGAGPAPDDSAEGGWNQGIIT